VADRLLNKARFGKSYPFFNDILISIKQLDEKKGA